MRNALPALQDALPSEAAESAAQAGPGKWGRLLEFLNALPENAVIVLGLSLLAVIWRLECVNKTHMSLSIFYFLPIALMVWRIGGIWAVLMPVLSAAVWLHTDLASGRVFPHWTIPYWSAAIRLCCFTLLARWLVLRKRFETECLARLASNETSRLKSNMMSLVNHENCNALTIIKLALVSLKESAPDSEKQIHCYDVIERAVQHLSMATTNFLNLSRLESGRFGLNMRKTRIEALATDTLLMLEPIIKGKKLDLRSDFPPLSVPVRADPEALSVVMSNLIANAVKYTPDKGAVTVRISRSDAEPPQVLFSVEDTGIGISEADRELIFSGYYRADKGKEIAKGYGVGLKVSELLIRGHGSRLQIESEPGKGSRFFFRLPLWTKREEAAAAGPAPDRKGARAQSQRNFQVRSKPRLRASSINGPGGTPASTV